MLDVRQPEVLNVAVLGFGGQVQRLLFACLKLKEETQKEIRVVAICDDCGRQALNFFVGELDKRRNPLARDYERMFDGAAIYSDDEEGLRRLFSELKGLNRVMVTSANSRHFTHLNCALYNGCKKIFVEKPVFKSLDEYNSFDVNTRRATIDVGLCLRYTTMVKIAEEKLLAYRTSLGRLKKVEAFEHVNFGHALTIILMNWRRSLELSGGLLLEKAIHDLDLALFFMKVLGLTPSSLVISTKASHEFFKKSRHQEILNRLMEDDLLRKSVESWDRASWQRRIDFSYLASGAIDWKATLEDFFEEFPENDDFTHSDIIPDQHVLTARIEMTDRSHVDFELEVKLDGFAQFTGRRITFTFEKGLADINIAGGVLAIVPKDSEGDSWLLVSEDDGGHAGGDTYVAHTLLDTLPQGRHKATLNDPEDPVQLATLMGLVSEAQAVSKQPQGVRLAQVNGRWAIKPMAKSLLPQCPVM